MNFDCLFYIYQNVTTMFRIHIKLPKQGRSNFWPSYFFFLSDRAIQLMNSLFVRVQLVPKWEISSSHVYSWQRWIIRWVTTLSSLDGNSGIGGTQSRLPVLWSFCMSWVQSKFNMTPVFFPGTPVSYLIKIQLVTVGTQDTLSLTEFHIDSSLYKWSGHPVKITY